MHDLVLRRHSSRKHVLDSYCKKRRYTTQIDAEEFLHKSIWATLVHEVVSVAKGITPDFVSHARDSFVTTIKAIIEIRGLLLQIGRQVPLSEVAENFQIYHTTPHYSV